MPKHEELQGYGRLKAQQAKPAILFKQIVHILSKSPIFECDVQADGGQTKTAIIRYPNVKGNAAVFRSR